MSETTEVYGEVDPVPASREWFIPLALLGNTGDCWYALTPRRTREEAEECLRSMTVDVLAVRIVRVTLPCAAWDGVDSGARICT